MTVQRQMIDVGDLFYEFKTEGDEIDGRYLGYQPIRWADGSPGRQHFIDTGEGVYKFTGTFNLDASLDMVEPGAYTIIVFKGVQPTRRGLNPVKVFSVQTEKTRVLPAPAPISQPAPAPISQPAPAPISQPAPFQPVGGAPVYQAMPNPPGNSQALRNANQQEPLAPPPADVQGQVPIQYLPDGTPIFGFTQDGTPLDAYGRIIPQGMGG